MIVKSAVALAVATEGVPSGTPATITISDGVATVATLNNLVVQRDRVTNAGAIPVWARDTDVTKTWAMGTYTYTATVAYAGQNLAAASPTPLKLTSLVGDLGDLGLEAEAELTEILAIIEKVPGHMACLSMFDKDATVPEWEKKVGNSFIYHHVSHGNLRCVDHAPARSYGGNDRRVVPAYPWCCSSQLALMGTLNDAYDLELGLRADEGVIPGFAAVMGDFLEYDDGAHHLRSVMQWVGVGDSSTDVAMGVPELQGAGKWPTCLAFFSSCLLGWEKGLARLFLDKGTRFVIAFRCRVVGGDGRAFAREFYTEWAKTRLDPDRVEAIFKAAGARFPRAEPVLFSAAKIIRQSCVGDVRHPQPDPAEYDWGNDVEHFKPKLLGNSDG